MANIGPVLPWGRFKFSKGVKGIREKITLSKRPTGRLRRKWKK